LRPPAIRRAARFGTQPSAAIACSTRKRASGLTRGLLLITRETVCRETAAAVATSSMVMLRPTVLRPLTGCLPCARLQDDANVSDHASSFFVPCALSRRPGAECDWHLSPVAPVWSKTAAAMGDCYRREKHDSGKLAPAHL
jgi:hypothetical protein